MLPCVPHVPLLPCPLTAQAVRRQRRTCDSFSPLQDPTHGREVLEWDETSQCHLVLKCVVSHHHSPSLWPLYDNIVSVHGLFRSFPSFCVETRWNLECPPRRWDLPQGAAPCEKPHREDQTPTLLGCLKTSLLGPGLTAGDACLTYVSLGGWP